LLVLDLEHRRVKVCRPLGFKDTAEHWKPMSQMRKLIMSALL